MIEELCPCGAEPLGTLGTRLLCPDCWPPFGVYGLDYPLSHIPPWCGMPLSLHSDGLGGCWGVLTGGVAERGEPYCKGCDCYRPKGATTLPGDTAAPPCPASTTIQGPAVRPG